MGESNAAGRRTGEEVGLSRCRSLPERAVERRVRRRSAVLLALAILSGACASSHRPASTEPGTAAESAARDVEPPREPMPTAAEIRRLALEARGLPRTHPGDIPPAEHWVGKPHDPASTPTRLAGQFNIRVNQDSSGRDQNETVVTVNPRDPLGLVGGANDYRAGPVKCGYYSSLDGGQTWVDGVLPESTYPYQGDPAAAFCGDGSVVYVCLSFAGAFQPHGLFFYRSTDGGRTWSAPRAVLNRPSGFPFADKEWVACDTTSGSFANRVYVTWTDFGALATPILMKWSGDGGRTWSGSIRVSDGGSTQGSVIAVGPDGAVNVAWSDGGSGSRIGFDRSTNGGASFETDRFPSSVVDIPGDPVFRRNSFPTLGADRSGGPNRGHLYVAWSDNRNGDPDILLVRSEDNGAAWSTPIRVNDDAIGNGKDQWFPWLAVDPKGRVIVTFFDRRRDPGNRAYEIWGAISRDGGRTFDTNFLVSDTRSDGDLNGFIGDYGGLAATADRLYPLWTDLRAGTGESDAYTDRFPNTFSYDEVRAVTWVDRATMDFEAQDPRFGVDIDYDVVSGRISELAVDAGFARAACAAARWPAPPFGESRVPPADDGYYYLVRARGASGSGTYGDGTPSRPNVRDPLDETLSTCP